MKSGKVTLGYKSTLKNLRNGKAQLIFLANNCPAIRKSELEYYAMLCKAKVYPYTGNNVTLGIFYFLIADFLKELHVENYIECHV